MDRRKWLRGIVHALSQLVWPGICEVCGRKLTDNEEVMCLHCELEMPLTKLHDSPDFNEIHERMAPHPPVERAASLMYYLREDPYTQLIHNAKYNSRPSILRYLGKRYGITLQQSGFMDGIDIIEAVPMHWFKEMTRGYNQTDYLAEGISEATGIPVGDHLRVRRHHKSQTRKSKQARWENTADAYTLVYADELAGKHVLLIDDVITTGSTVAACAEQIQRAGDGTKISVVSIGLTRLH